MSHHSRRATMREVPAGYWTTSQAYVFAAVTLLIGIAVGYLVRGSAGAGPAGQSTTVPADSTFAQQGPSFADVLAQNVNPLLVQLQSRPNDPELLAEIGNAYYDGRDYDKAIEYYQRSLKLRPDNVNVRTDMGTAMWYSGNADGALKQYEQSLKYQPTHANTLMNMGIVKWNGKKDGKGAIASWEKLLATNPNFAERQKVEELLQNVKREMGSGS